MRVTDAPKPDVPRPSTVAPPPTGTPWTVLHLVRWAAAYLTEKGVESGRLDAEHLLADTLGTTRLDLYLRFDRPLDAAELANFKPRLLERAGRKPLQYILGRTAFRELELSTDARVLIPRPETEELVGAVLERARAWGREGLTGLDVGTGSGAIALSLAREGPFARVVATDPAEGALELARENARVAGVLEKLVFRRGSGFAPVEPGERFDVVVSNPPYISEKEFPGLAPEVRDWEPRGALVAADEGLAVLRELVDGAAGVVRPGGLLAFEVGEGQARWVAERVRGTATFAEPEVLRDLSRRERIVISTRNG